MQHWVIVSLLLCGQWLLSSAVQWGLYQGAQLPAPLLFSFAPCVRFTVSSQTSCRIRTSSRPM